MSTPILHPKAHDYFVGHTAPMKAFEQAITSKRLHHAWLLTGDEGIGKATFTYRLVRGLLAGAGGDAPLLSASAVEEAPSFSLFGEEEAPAAEAPVAPTTLEAFNTNLSIEHPVSRRIAGGTHGDLLVLEAGVNEKTGKKGEISVDMVREVGAFMALTPSESAWRIVVIDGADSMNNAAANALLKSLEEPPAHGMLFLIAHSAGKILPTIHSRCRHLEFSPLEESECKQVVNHFYPDIKDKDLDEAMVLAETSVGQILALLEQGSLKNYKGLLKVLAEKGAGSKDFIKLAEKMAKEDPAGWAWFARSMERLILLMCQAQTDSLQTTAMLKEEKAAVDALARTRSLDSWMKLWDNLTQLMRNTHVLNLEKRQTAFQLLDAMAHAKDAA